MAAGVYGPVLNTYSSIGISVHEFGTFFLLHMHGGYVRVEQTVAEMSTSLFVIVYFQT